MDGQAPPPRIHGGNHHGYVHHTNLSALNTYRNLNATQNDLSKSLEKLSRVSASTALQTTLRA